MSTLYPGAADDNTSLPNPGSMDITDSANPLLKHNYQHDTVNDAIKAIQAKLGVGGGTPGADGQLLCVVAGKTVWQSYAVGGDLSGTLPNPTLVNIGGVAGSYGSSTKVPVITVDTKGRIVSVNEVTITGGGGGGGAASPLTTKGDIWVFGPADTRLPIGANGKILTADSTAAPGMKWADAPAAGVWGQITGTLSAQTDLAAALALKANTSSLATVATTGAYNDLTGKPSIPAAQVNSDWNAASGAAQILNKPTLGSLAAKSTVTLTTDVTGALPVANGGTGSSSAAAARTALSAAQSGSNSDITALTATPVITGGTATADPTAALGLVTKQYVDNRTTTTLVRNEIPGGSINGSNTAYTTASTFATGSLKVYLNGQRLNPGSGNDYVEVTQGFTMQYAPATGDILLVDYETTNSAFIQGSNSIVVQETPTGLVNGSNAAFTTQLGKYVANTLGVFINGLQQTKTTDYAETTPGSGIFTFTTAPATGDAVRISYQFSTGASGNADTVDGFHASSSPTAGNLLPLNSSAKVPVDVLGTGAGTAAVATSQSTTSTSFTDLTTVGPSVTVTIGANGLAFVALSCDMANSLANAYTVTGFSLSGANTQAAADALVIGTLPASAELNTGTAILLTGLTPGVTTFKLQYRVTSGTGTFLSRKISVIPL